MQYKPIFWYFRAQNICTFHSAHILMHSDAYWCILSTWNKISYFCMENRQFYQSICNKNHLFDNFVHKTFAPFVLLTFWCILMHFDAFWCILMHFRALWCILTHIDSIWAEFWCISENASKCIGVHQNASACIKMHQMFVEWIVQMLCAQIEQRSGFYFI